MSLPKGISTFSQIVFLVDDLWLYVYDNINYTGIIK